MSVVVSAHSPNEQGVILNRYLNKWGLYLVISVSLPAIQSLFIPTSVMPMGRYLVLTTSFFRPVFSLELTDCFVVEEDPLYVSDHFPVVAKMFVHLTVEHPPNPISPCLFRPNWNRCSPIHL